MVRNGSQRFLCEVWCDADPVATRCVTVSPFELSQTLPDKIMLGCISYPVGAFGVNALLFQLHFMVMSVCRREIPKCGCVQKGMG
jgi:hypothetical protein